MTNNWMTPIKKDLLNEEDAATADRIRFNDNN